MDWIRLWLLGVLTALVGMGASAHAGLESESVHVIVHDTAQATTLDRRHLRAIYTMHMRRWPAGPLVHVLTLPPEDPRFEVFAQRCLGLPPRVLRRLWQRNIFTGIGWVPQIVQDSRRMIELVARTPGAIGYVVGSIPEMADVRVVEGLCEQVR